MVGAGALAPISDQSSSFNKTQFEKSDNLESNKEKARNLAEKMRESVGFDGVSFESNGCLQEIVGLGDIVSCATNSEMPFVKRERLKAGAHLNLVGSVVFVDNEAAFEG